MSPSWIAVLTEMSAHPRADVGTLTAKVRSRLGLVSTQAVYDVLYALTEADLIRRIEPAGSLARSLRGSGGRQPPRGMPNMGEGADLDFATGPVPCLKASNANGFVIDQTEVKYWGICPACIRTPDRPSRTPTWDPRRIMTEHDGSTASNGATSVSDRNSLTQGTYRPDAAARRGIHRADGSLQPRARP